jgi:hypothetical protein
MVLLNVWTFFAVLRCLPGWDGRVRGPVERRSEGRRGWDRVGCEAAPASDFVASCHVVGKISMPQFSGKPPTFEGIFGPFG